MSRWSTLPVLKWNNRNSFISIGQPFTLLPGSFTMNRFLTVSSVVLLMLFVLTPCTIAAGSMFRADPQHTGIFATGSTEPNNVLKWSFDEQNNRITSPAVEDGVVYFGSEDQHLYALYTANGTEKWKFATGGIVRSAPALSDSAVFFGSGDGNMYALNAADGSVKWQVPTNPSYDGIGYSSPAVSDGSVYVVSYDRNLYAIDADTGTIRWKFPFVSAMGSETGSSPAVSDGVVFFGDLNRIMYAVWAVNGTEKWRYTSPGTFMASIPPSAPVVYDGVLYMGGPGSRNLTALWAENGTEKMRISRGYANWELVSPAAKDGVLYTGSTDLNLYAIDAATGDQIWSFYLGSLLRASPSISEDIVYAPSAGKVLYAIYRGNGTEKWRFSPPNNKGVWGAPVISDGVVYIDGDSADHLYAVGNQEQPPQFLSGRVLAGEAGNLTARGLRDVPVRLFGSDTPDEPGALVTGTVTDSYGYYLIPVPEGPYQYFNLVHEDTIPGSNPVGAQSSGGTVKNASWIQYISPVDSSPLTDNNFWDFVPTVHGNFTASRTTGLAPLTVEFTDDSTGFPVTWNWVHEFNTTIGNGPITGLSPNTTYTYTEPGVYSVQMRVFNQVSSDWVTKVDCITVLAPPTAPVIINHTTAKPGLVPRSAIENAKSTLHIAYGHTSHGSQLITGMNGLITFPGAPYGGPLYQWNNGGSGGALDLHDYFVDGDLGNPDRTTWAERTRNYLDNPANADVNVVIWSWCGQVSSSSEADITTYLGEMSQLETEYPGVRFVYMTGHLDGSGRYGNLHLRNEQIRNYCRIHNKVLFDFADIESYDPDGVTNYFLKYSTDGCNYDYNRDGETSQSGDPALPSGGDRNWAIDWQDDHPAGVDWYSCSAAHTQPLNANQKAFAAWWLWARLGGWDGTSWESSTTRGIFRSSSWHNWILDRNLDGIVDLRDHFGSAGDLPLLGDFNNDGVMDRAVFRNGQWIFDYDLDGDVDARDQYGTSGDIPLAGEFNNDDTMDRAVFRNGQWIFDYDLDGDVDKRNLYGIDGDVPLAGDLNNDGVPDRAVFRNGQWIVDFGMDGVVDTRDHFGVPTDLPLVGRLDVGSSMDRAVFRNGQWIIDDGIDGSADLRLNFGTTGDLPLIWYCG